MIYGLIRVQDLSTGGAYEVERWFNEESKHNKMCGLGSYRQDDIVYTVVIEYMKV